MVQQLVLKVFPERREARSLACAVLCRFHGAAGSTGFRVGKTFNYVYDRKLPAGCFTENRVQSAHTCSCCSTMSGEPELVFLCFRVTVVG